MDIIRIHPRLTARAAAYNALFARGNPPTVCRARTAGGLAEYGDFCAEFGPAGVRASAPVAE